MLSPGRGADDIEELTNVWRDSVEATYHFLSLDAFDRLELLVRDEQLPRLRLQVAERNGCMLGFIGRDGGHVAMMQVADEARSMGVGSRLLAWAKQPARRLTLEVNGQNPRAAVCYVNRGLVPVGWQAGVGVN